MQRPLLKIATLTALAFIALTAVLYYLDSRIPRATAIMQIHPNPSHLQIQIHPNARFLQWEVESPAKKVLSPKILKQALQKLNLAATNQNIQDLKDSTTVKIRRGTDFLDITVKDPIQTTAVSLANAIAEAYCQTQTESETTRRHLIIKALDDEVSAAAALADTYHQDLRSLVKKFAFNFPREKNTFPKVTVLPFDEADSSIARSLRQNQYRVTKESYEESLSMLREMKLKQQEARDLLKKNRSPVTIHERAK